jgi:ABC-type Fe3+ transport system permease subunit
MKSKMERVFSINTVGWLLVVLGVLAAICSLLGIAALFWGRSDVPLNAPGTSELYLHDTYYVIQPFHTVWTFILTALLASTIAVIGYLQTSHAMRGAIWHDITPRASESRE